MRGPWSLNREKNNDWPGPSKSGADWLTSPKARAARNFFIGPRRSESRRSSEVQRFESLRREAQPPPFRSAGERSRSSELQQYRVKHRRAQAAAVSGKHRRAQRDFFSFWPRVCWGRGCLRHVHMFQASARAAKRGSGAANLRHPWPDQETRRELSTCL